MRPAIVTIIVIAFGALIVWIGTDSEISHLAEVLPFLGGHEVGLYDWAGLAVLVITAWGIGRLFSNSEDES